MLEIGRRHLRGGEHQHVMVIVIPVDQAVARDTGKIQLIVSRLFQLIRHLFRHREHPVKMCKEQVVKRVLAALLPHEPADFFQFAVMAEELFQQMPTRRRMHFPIRRKPRFCPAPFLIFTHRLRFRPAPFRIFTHRLRFRPTSFHIFTQSLHSGLSRDFALRLPTQLLVQTRQICHGLQHVAFPAHVAFPPAVPFFQDIPPAFPRSGNKLSFLREDRGIHVRIAFRLQMGEEEIQ